MSPAALVLGVLSALAVGTETPRPDAGAEPARTRLCADRDADGGWALRSCPEAAPGGAGERRGARPAPARPGRGPRSERAPRRTRLCPCVVAGEPLRLVECPGRVPAPTCCPSPPVPTAAARPGALTEARRGRMLRLT